MEVTTAWIETTHLVAHGTSAWRVIVNGEVLHKGELSHDPSGCEAHDVALTWLRANELAFGGWKHAYDRSPPEPEEESAASSTRRVSAPRLVHVQNREAWIETTHVVAEKRTLWRIQAAGEVLAKGEVLGDRSGAGSHDAAVRWLTEEGLEAAGWTHALDRTPATTQEPVPKTYGWVSCTTGHREPVVLTASQVAELDAGVIPCPVCGRRCGPTLTVSDDARRIALSWNGARWRAGPYRSR